MAFIVWSESLSVGVDQIDLQHKMLVGILNALHEAMRDGSEQSDLEQVIKDLLNYTRYHFHSEEKMMLAAGYPGLAEHQKKHQAMLGQVEGFAELLATGRALVSIKLLEFLKQWLNQHILETDRKFGAFEVARRAT